MQYPVNDLVVFVVTAISDYGPWTQLAIVLMEEEDSVSSAGQSPLPPRARESQQNLALSSADRQQILAQWSLFPPIEA